MSRKKNQRRRHTHTTGQSTRNSGVSRKFERTGNVATLDVNDVSADVELSVNQNGAVEHGSHAGNDLTASVNTETMVRDGAFSKETQNPKNVPILHTIVVFATAFLVATFIVELVASYFGGTTLLLTFGLGVFGSVISVAKAVSAQAISDEAKNMKPMSLREHIVDGFAKLKEQLLGSSVALALLALALVLLMVTFSAYMHLAGRIICWLQSSVEMVTAPVKPSSSPQPPIIEDMGYGEAGEPSLSPVTQPPREELPNADQEREDPPDDGLPPEETQTYIAIADQNREYTIEPEELEWLYYQSGEYAIEDWDNDAVIIAAVRARIEAYTAQQRKNQFDTIAPQNVKDLAAYASAIEAARKTSADLDQVIEMRLEIYGEYPCYALAKLLAENYVGYASSYQTWGSNSNAVEYHYAQAIKYFHECLAFQSSKNSVVKLLSLISDRYYNLATGLPEEENQTHAFQLSHAYKAVAEEYGGDATGR